jgi:hypothetical protein
MFFLFINIIIIRGYRIQAKERRHKFSKQLPLLISTHFFIIMSSDESKKDIKMDKQSGSLECEVCGQVFDTLESFKEHKLSEDKDEELKYKGTD